MELDDYIVSTDKNQLQLERIHHFLSREAYWCLGIAKDVVRSAIEASFCFGLYEKKSGLQIGFARIVTDEATFAWLCDVYVEKELRGLGLSKLLMDACMEFLNSKNLRRICLTTKDAHPLYEKYGFQVTQTPTYWMEIKDNDIYKKMKADFGR